MTKTMENGMRRHLSELTIVLQHKLWWGGVLREEGASHICGVLQCVAVCCSFIIEGRRTTGEHEDHGNTPHCAALRNEVLDEQRPHYIQKPPPSSS